MPGISGALDIARWSMYASQLAMEVTSHNIANANTEGYSKQNLEVRANNPITMAPGQFGTGVKATEVTRQYDAYLSAQVVQKSADDSYWSSQKGAMDQIESIFNETDGNGINALMGDFWNAWGALENNPDGVPERNSLISTTDNLVSMVHDMDTNLRANQQNLDMNIRGAVDDTNKIISQIADLNNNITSVEVKGMINANDLRDQRDLLLQKLSQHLDINYYEDSSTGQVNVFIMGGTPLILGKDHNSLSTSYNTTTGFTDVLWNDTSGRSINLTSPTLKLKSGDITGMVDVRDNQIGSYLDSLNTLTQELVWQVNSLHSEGTGLQSVHTMTGTVQTSGDADNLSTAFLFSNRYTPGGSFDIVEYDNSGQVVGTYNITPAGNTVGDLRTAINTASGGTIAATLTGGTSGALSISAVDPTHTFAIKPSAGGTASNALAILGVNTYFSWDETVGQPVDDITQTVAVNQVLKTNPNLISSGYLDNNNMVAPGANEVASAISALQDKVIPNMGGAGVNTTMDAYYSSLVAQVGVDSQNATQNQKFNDTLLSQYTQRKEGVSGVNLDDEMTDLLKNQQIYQASAKLISICDTMMQSLLSIQ
ncbi:MAG TPA: flagellar hook-associated protein FlgK [Desulfomonilia bacterium]|nr:flagellar hook-associated protein FlgK [Desulfomonilia bacterium]